MSRSPSPGPAEAADGADWQRRVVGRSLKAATQRSIDRGSSLIRAAATLLERSNGDGFTVQDVADEAGQSLRTLYQYFESKDDLLLAVFEESQRTYAKLIGKDIAGLDDPLERLGGALVAAVRMNEFSDTGVDRGLARLRSKLSAVEPDLVARSQQPVTSLFEELIDDAADAGAIECEDRQGATYMVLAMKTAYLTSATLGNDAGVTPPRKEDLVGFVLRGLGVSVDETWIADLGERLELPRGSSRSRRPAAS